MARTLLSAEVEVAVVIHHADANLKINVKGSGRGRPLYTRRKFATSFFPSSVNTLSG